MPASSRSWFAKRSMANASRLFALPIYQLRPPGARDSLLGFDRHFIGRVRMPVAPPFAYTWPTLRPGYETARPTTSANLREWPRPFWQEHFAKHLGETGGTPRSME